MYKLFLFVTLILGLTESYAQQKTIQGLEWTGESVTRVETPLILCEFWATWCGPCIKAMPHVEYLMKKNEDKITAIYVSDESSYTIQQWMKRKEINFLSISDVQKKNHDKYAINAIPVSIIFGPKGEILWKGSPSSLTQELIDKLYAKNNEEKRFKKRISFYREKEGELEQEFETFNYESNQLKFREVKASYKYFLQNYNSFSFKGSTIELLSELYKIPKNEIEIDESLIKNIEITMENLSVPNQIIVLDEFIKDKLMLDANLVSKSKEGYKITKGELFEGMSNQVYDFSENNAKFLADDMNVQIDNATGDGMIEILNQFSDYSFVGFGFGKEIYDWNIHYKFNELTLDQLKNELELKVDKTKIEIDYLVVKRISN